MSHSLPLPRPRRKIFMRDLREGFRRCVRHGLEYTATRVGVSMKRIGVSFLLMLGTLSAQSNQAFVSGVVTDSQGAVIPGATISATNIATGVRTTATTNDTGFYAIPNLPVGVYTLTVEHAGFRRYVREDIVLNTGQTLGLDVRMELGAVNESVTVAGETPLVETRTSDVTQLIESKSVANLPLGNRRTLNVVRMTGAALFVDYPNNPGNANPNFSLAGGRAQSQMAWSDGGAAQNMRLGVGQINLDPPVEVVEEIKVLTNSYSAE